MIAPDIMEDAEMNGSPVVLEAGAGKTASGDPCFTGN
jgi:hypothetical protein